MKEKKTAPPPSAYLPLACEGEKRFFHPSDPFWKGFGIGVILFLLFLAILLFAGDLSASKFIYVDF
jgi:hypothetical protein